MISVPPVVVVADPVAVAEQAVTDEHESVMVDVEAVLEPAGVNTESDVSQALAVCVEHELLELELELDLLELDLDSELVEVSVVVGSDPEPVGSFPFPGGGGGAGLGPPAGGPLPPGGDGGFQPQQRPQEPLLPPCDPQNSGMMQPPPESQSGPVHTVISHRQYIVSSRKFISYSLGILNIHYPYSLSQTV